MSKFVTMNKIVIVLSLLFASIHVIAQEENLADSDVELYIQKYKSLAITEQKRTGVPASITLAQAIHESASGTSELATQANNHFGIKCKNTWTGETYLHDDDKKQECFRKYFSAEQSFIDHSDFLKTNRRYEILFTYEMTNYNAWASGLKRAGYATNPVYVKRITGLVEKYNLQQYTYEALGTKPGEVVPEKDVTSLSAAPQDPSNYFKGIKGFWAKNGDMLLEKAIEYKIKYPRLLAMNDLKDEPLESDMFIFTERKRNRGSDEFHIVKENEKMNYISQREAILLDQLYELNNMIPGQEPETGEKLYLQYKNSSIPTLKKIPQEIVETKTEIIETKTEVEKSNFPTSATEKIATKSDEIINTTKEETNPLLIKKEVVLETIPTEEKVKEVEVLNNTTVGQKVEVAKEVETKKVLVSSNENILDVEKANRVAKLLDGKPIEYEVKEVQVETPKAKIEIAEPVIQPQEIKKNTRTYDEEGVSDSVKDLKKRFDMLMYQERPKKVVVQEAKKTVVQEVKKVVVPNVADTAKQIVVIKKTPEKVKPKEPVKKGLVQEAKKEIVKKQEVKKEIKPESKKESKKNEDINTSQKKSRYLKKEQELKKETLVKKDVKKETKEKAKKVEIKEVKKPLAKKDIKAKK